MTDALLRGEYLYEEVYPAFKEGTDEKKKTAQLNWIFLKCLAEAGVGFSEQAPLKIADIGCGPADTVINYLKGVDYRPGFSIRAVDFLADYAGPGGKAAANLSAAQHSGTLKIEAYSVRQGNAFGGRLTELLATQEDPEPRNSFDFSFLSHMMYHAHAQADIDTVLRDVAYNILNQEAAGILYHVASRTPRTFQYFRDRYGSRADNTRLTDTPTMDIHNPPAVIEESCRRNRIPCFHLDFSAQLFFHSLAPETWQAFKNPARYAALAESDPQAYEDLKRLYFIVQRSPTEFAQDSSRTGLSDYIDEISEEIGKNQGSLLLEETLQTICPPEASSAFQRKVESALETTRERS